MSRNLYTLVSFTSWNYNVLTPFPPPPFYFLYSSYLNDILHETSFYTPFILLLWGRTVFMYNFSFCMNLLSCISHWYCFHLPTTRSVTSHSTLVTFFNEPSSSKMPLLFFPSGIVCFSDLSSISFTVFKWSNCHLILIYLGFDIFHESSSASFMQLPRRLVTFCSASKKGGQA